MKTNLFITIITFLSLISISSCTKDDDYQQLFERRDLDLEIDHAFDYTSSPNYAIYNLDPVSISVGETFSLPIEILTNDSEQDYKNFKFHSYGFPLYINDSYLGGSHHITEENVNTVTFNSTDTKPGTYNYYFSIWTETKTYPDDNSSFRLISAAMINISITVE